MIISCILYSSITPTTRVTTCPNHCKGSSHPSMLGSSVFLFYKLNLLLPSAFCATVGYVYFPHLREFTTFLFLYFWLTSLSIIASNSNSNRLRQLNLSYCRIVFYFVNLHLLEWFICGYTFGLFSCLGYSAELCSEHKCVHVLSNLYYFALGVETKKWYCWYVLNHKVLMIRIARFWNEDNPRLMRQNWEAW